MVGVPSVAELDDEDMRDVTPKGGVFSDPTPTRATRAAASRAAAPVTVEAKASDPVIEAKAEVKPETAADPVTQRGTAAKTEAAKPEVEPEPEKFATSDQTAGPVEVAKTEDALVEGDVANPMRAAFDKLVKGLKLAENINEANALWNDAAETLDRIEVEYPDLFAEVCDVYDTRANALTA